MDDGLVFSSRGKRHVHRPGAPAEKGGAPGGLGRAGVRRGAPLHRLPLRAGAFLGERETISFASLSPDHSLFMVEAFRKCLNDASEPGGRVSVGLWLHAGLRAPAPLP